MSERATGFEPATSSLGSGQPPAKNVSRVGVSGPSENCPSTGPSSRVLSALPADPDLAVVIASWAELPAALRSGIVAMVRSANS